MYRLMSNMFTNKYSENTPKLPWLNTYHTVPVLKSNTSRARGRIWCMKQPLLKTHHALTLQPDISTRTHTLQHSIYEVSYVKHAL